MLYVFLPFILTKLLCLKVGCAFPKKDLLFWGAPGELLREFVHLMVSQHGSWNVLREVAANVVSQVVQNTVELLHAWKTPAPMKKHSKYIMFMIEAFQINLKYRRLLTPSN